MPIDLIFSQQEFVYPCLAVCAVTPARSVAQNYLRTFLCPGHTTVCTLLASSSQQSLFSLAQIRNLTTRRIFPDLLSSSNRQRSDKAGRRVHSRPALEK